MHTAFKRTIESITETSNESKFVEKGFITPEEFVKAGDFLCETCPTWQWQSAKEKRYEVKFLPEQKQYLVTRNVPCLKRAKAMEEFAGGEEALEGEDEGWVAAGKTTTVATTANATEKNIQQTQTIVVEEEKEDEIPDIGAVSLEDNNDIDDDDESIPDMEDVEDDDAIIIAQPKKESQDLLKTRTYDISITWDKYYQTPRVWLNGYDEHKNVLDPKSVYEDISADHAKKTVTIDPHPHTNVSSASVHPCKHASVMKKLVRQMTKTTKDTDGSGEEKIETPSVERYLIVFLKFMQSAMPTIEYDYTTSG